MAHPQGIPIGIVFLTAMLSLWFLARLPGKSYKQLANGDRRIASLLQTMDEQLSSYTRDNGKIPIGKVFNLTPDVTGMAVIISDAYCIQLRGGVHWDVRLSQMPLSVSAFNVVISMQQQDFLGK